MKAIISALVASSVVFGVSAADGVTVAAANWQTVNSVATGEQRLPAIAANRNGHVAVVWEDDRDSTDPGSNLRSRVFLRLFRNGTPVFEKDVSGGGSSGVTNWRHITPDVGVDDRGNVVVAWADDPDGNGVYNIPFRVYSPSGTLLGSGRANADAAGTQLNPSVAVDQDGLPSSTGVAFTVAWEDVQGTNPPDVKAAGFTNNTSRTYEKIISPASGTHRRPDVAVSADGDALVVWEDDADGNAEFDIVVTRLSRWGTVVMTRRNATSSTGGQQLDPSIAATFHGDFAVAWESDHTGTLGVWTRSFTMPGAPRHADVQVAGAGARAPGIGIDDQNNTVVGWTLSNVDTWARGFNPDGTGTARLASQALMNISAGTQQSMVVAVSPWGEVSVAYRDDNDGNTWGQIYLGQGIINSNW